LALDCRALFIYTPFRGGTEAAAKSVFYYYGYEGYILHTLLPNDFDLLAASVPPEKDAMETYNRFESYLNL
jgi:hypothetical protein